MALGRRDRPGILGLAAAAAAARKATDGPSARVQVQGGTDAEDRYLSPDQAVADLGTLLACALLALSKEVCGSAGPCRNALN